MNTNVKISVMAGKLAVIVAVVVLVSTWIWKLLGVAV